MSPTTNSDTQIERQRIEWVDWLKGIMMLVIIISHIGAPEIYVRFYTPVFLTIYFFLSGYTWSSKDKFKNYFVRKTQGLVVPLLCLGTINAVLAIIAEGDSWIDRFGGLLIQRSCIWDDLWFIACLFSAQIIFYAVYRISNRTKYTVVSLTAISLCLAILGFIYIEFVNVKLPWQFENALVLQLFVAMGYLYRHYVEERVKNFENAYLTPFLLILLYVISVLAVNNDVNIHSERYANEFVFVLSAVIGLLLLVDVAKRLDKTSLSRSRLYRFVVWGGRTHLYIMPSRVRS